MLASVGALWRYRDLLLNLVLRDLRVKYKGSTLGFAWSLLHPLVMAAVYTVAFKVVLRIGIDRFPLFLLSGLLPWVFFAQSLSQATGSVADNGTLVRKVAFPRLALPMAAVATQLVQFALMYSVIVPLGALFGGGLSPVLLAIVPLAVLQCLFTAGLALVLATAYVYFRDTRHLLEVALQVWFWVTPVVYSLSLVPDALRPWLGLNPMTGFVTAYQRAVLDHALPGPGASAALAGVALAAFIVGLAVFTRHERRFAELV
jgi:ABC-type polysaccharide/polyol phosphate export permease